MLTFARLNQLYDLADDPSPDWRDTAARSEAATAYHEALIDHVPRNEAEAAELYQVAMELVPACRSVIAAVRRRGRKLTDLRALRQLELKAREQVDAFDPPLRYEERVLRSCIAFLARPVLAWTKR